MPPKKSQKKSAATVSEHVEPDVEMANEPALSGDVELPTSGELADQMADIQIDYENAACALPSVSLADEDAERRKRTLKEFFSDDEDRRSSPVPQTEEELRVLRQKRNDSREKFLREAMPGRESSINILEFPKKDDEMEEPRTTVELVDDADGTDEYMRNLERRVNRVSPTPPTNVVQESNWAAVAERMRNRVIE